MLQDPDETTALRICLSPSTVFNLASLFSLAHGIKMIITSRPLGLDLVRLVFVLVLLVSHRGAEAQSTAATDSIPRPWGVVELLEVTGDDAIERTYRYALQNRFPSGQELPEWMIPAVTAFFLDLSNPGDPGANLMMRGEGGFSTLNVEGNDWKREYIAPHPPVVVRVEEGRGFRGFPTFTGELSIMTRVTFADHAGLHPGEEFRGVSLRSPAIPGYRLYFVSFWNPISEVRTTSDEGFIDGLHEPDEGVTLAPGRMPDTVDAAYLVEQLERACEVGHLASCESKLALAHRARNASDRDDASDFHQTLEELLASFEGLSAPHPWVPLVFPPTILALQLSGLSFPH